MTFNDPLGILSDQQTCEIDGFLERYKGHLRIDQIAEGIRFTLCNARDLFDDASLLLSAGRLARSMTLLITSWEELGKISVIAAMSRIPKNNQKLWADAWESFRSHQHKSTWSFVHTYSDEARQYPELMVTAACQQFAFSDVAERIRQFGLYTDFHSAEKRWLSPNEVTEGDVNQWYQRVEPVLSGHEAYAVAGLYSERALAIQQEVYASFNADRLRRKHARPEDAARAIQEGPALAKQYFRRLVEEKVIDPDADFSVLGIPLSELLDAEESPG